MMKRFIKAVKKKGFSIEEESNQMDEEGKYILSLSRMDAVDFDSINEVTDLLVEISEKYEGEYDGWETVVIEGEFTLE
ncbi:ribonuclease E inhibitor RraB [Metabacillus litoralis]|jgi:regulator of RNase E activity RraB|nr:ribonuclease E inhibitor RraB [Metabacillus litoralis]